MVYIYLPAPYCHLNLEVTKANLMLAAGFSAVPAVFLVWLCTCLSDLWSNFRCPQVCLWGPLKDQHHSRTSKWLFASQSMKCYTGHEGIYATKKETYGKDTWANFGWLDNVCSKDGSGWFWQGLGQSGRFPECRSFLDLLHVMKNSSLYQPH